MQSAQRNLSKKPEVFPKFFWTKKGLPCYNMNQGNTKVFPVNPPSFIMNSILTSFAASSFLELVYFFVFPLSRFSGKGNLFFVPFFKSFAFLCGKGLGKNHKNTVGYLCLLFRLRSECQTDTIEKNPTKEKASKRENIFSFFGA